MAKTILITGGTTGIGRCTAYKFGRNGYNMAFTSRNEERGKKFEAELREAGIEASFFQLDVTDEAAVKATIDGVVARYGAMQTIVNNAGIAGETKLLADNSTDNFREMIETNVMGLYYGMKYAIRHYLTVGGGRIVNLASIAGLNGIPYAVQYCATKHAVVGLTKGVAVGILLGCLFVFLILKRCCGRRTSARTENERLFTAFFILNVKNSEEKKYFSCFIWFIL